MVEIRGELGYIPHPPGSQVYNYPGKDGAEVCSLPAPTPPRQTVQ